LKTFENEVNKDRSVFSHFFSVTLFLNSAFITEQFNRERKIPNDNSLLHA